MNRLKWWFRIIGVLYCLIGIGFIPLINSQRLSSMLPNFDAPIGGTAYWGFLDFTFMFGLDLIVIGAYMLYCSREPAKHLTIVYLVILLEIIRGIADDIYMITRGYTPGFLAGFIIVHLIIIITGFISVRKAKSELGNLTA